MHFESLTNEGKKILPALKNFTGFYLAGGTALALSIGHRISVDFDLFSGNRIERGLLKKIRSAFANPNVKPLINNPEELTVLADGVKVTFLYYPFPNIYKTVDWNGLAAMNVKDIAAAKAYAIGRRGTLKDYVDLYYLLSEKRTDINQIIKTSRKKYGDEFNARLFAEQLIYLEDLEEEKIRFLKKAVSIAELKNFFIGQVKKINIQ